MKPNEIIIPPTTKTPSKTIILNFNYLNFILVIKNLVTSLNYRIFTPTHNVNSCSNSHNY